MYAQEDVTQVSFHYDNGQSESFNIPISPSEFKQQINLLLERPWLTLHLFDQTVFIYTSRIIKVEVKPALPEIVGVGVFPNCQRVTTMQRGATGRFAMGS